MRVTRFVVGLVLLVLAFAGSATAQEQQFSVSTVSGVSVRVRAEPDMTARQIDSVPSGTSLPVVRVVGAWVEVTLPPKAGRAQKTGYVSKALGKLEPIVAIAKAEPAKPVSRRPDSPVPPTPPPAKPVTAPTPPTPATETKTPVTQKAAVAEENGQFGAGILLGNVAIPFLLYDMGGSNSAIGMFAVAPGVFAADVGMVHRFPQDKKSQGLYWEPYAGGGLSMVRVDAGLGSESAIGGFGTVGVFFTHKKIPSVRFSGALVIEFTGHGSNGSAIALGAAYFFPKSK